MNWKEFSHTSPRLSFKTPNSRYWKFIWKSYNVTAEREYLHTFKLSERKECDGLRPSRLAASASNIFTCGRTLQRSTAWVRSIEADPHVHPIISVSTGITRFSHKENHSKERDACVLLLDHLPSWPNNKMFEEQKIGFWIGPALYGTVRWRHDLLETGEEEGFARITFFMCCRNHIYIFFSSTGFDSQKSSQSSSFRNSGVFISCSALYQILLFLLLQK